MHFVRAVVSKTLLNAVVLSLLGTALLGASLAAAQVAARSTDPAQKTDLMGLPNLSGE